jgi:3-oxoacyl-[acyl-carrier-protein] synthase II
VEQDLITRFDASLFKVRFACELKDFDVEQFIQRKEARRLDPFAQYALGDCR